MTIDIVIWATAAGLIVHIIAIYGHLQSRSKSRAEIELTVKQAIDDAKVAKVRADEFHEKLAIHIAAFALYREHIARDYINRESMRDTEKRLTEAMREMEGRLTRAYNGGRQHG